jgi:phage N-6-adenine-methyltransferase
MFSKASDEWSTPQDYYDALHLEFAFQWDAAATRENAKCGGHCYFGPDHGAAEYRDALAVTPWATFQRQRFWLNPPYSKCRAFIAKAAAEAQRGATVVCLVPSRTDTRWWHDHVWDSVRHQARPGVEIRFHRGRL